MRPDAIRDEGLRELGAKTRLRRVAFDKEGRGRTYLVRCRLLAAYKVELKKTHRAIALECHPDRTVDDPESERTKKEDRFKRITRAVEYVMGLSACPPKARPPVARMPSRMPNVRAARVIVVNLGGRSMGIDDLRYGTAPRTNSTTADDWPWQG